MRYAYVYFIYIYIYHVFLGTNSAFEDARLFTNALKNWNENNWKENIRNYELGLRARGSFYVNLARASCLSQHQMYDNLLIRNFKFSSALIYSMSWLKNDDKERDTSSKNG